MVQETKVEIASHQNKSEFQLKQEGEFVYFLKQAFLSLGQNDLKNAKVWFTSAIVKTDEISKKVFAYNEFAGLLYEMQQFELAEEYFLSAISCDPNVLRTYLNLSRTLYVQNKMDKALPLIFFAIEKYIKKPGSYKNSDILELMAELDVVDPKFIDQQTILGFINVLKKERSKRPNLYRNLDTVVCFRFAAFALSVKDFDLANILFKYTINGSTDPILRSDAYNSMGVVKEQQNDMISAEKCFQRSLEINKNNQQAQYNLGRIFAAEGRVQKAVEQLKPLSEKLESTPRKNQEADYHDTLTVLGFAYGMYAIGLGVEDRGKDKFDLALLCFQTVLSKNPEHVLAAAHHAELLNASGYKTKAGAYKAVVEAKLSNHRLLLVRSQLFFNLGNFERATHDINKVLSTDPSSSKAQLALRRTKEAALIAMKGHLKNQLDESSADAQQRLSDRDRGFSI